MASTEPLGAVVAFSTAAGPVGAWVAAEKEHLARGLVNNGSYEQIRAELQTLIKRDSSRFSSQIGRRKTPSELLFTALMFRFVAERLAEEGHANALGPDEPGARFFVEKFKDYAMAAWNRNMALATYTPDNPNPVSLDKGIADHITAMLYGRYNPEKPGLVEAVPALVILEEKVRRAAYQESRPAPGQS